MRGLLEPTLWVQGSTPGFNSEQASLEEPINKSHELDVYSGDLLGK